MRGGRALIGSQEVQVLVEYRRAVINQNMPLASRIYTANPDLQREFREIDQEEATKHFTETH